MMELDAGPVSDDRTDSAAPSPERPIEPVDNLEPLPSHEVNHSGETSGEAGPPTDNGATSLDPISGEWMNGKPVLYRDAKTIISDPSGEFHEKLLCDGLIFNAGEACPFSCAYCYVESVIRRLVQWLIKEYNRRTGENRSFHELVIRRRNALEVIKSQLVAAYGSPIYDDPDDRRVIYSSTLVDVAANKELFEETVAICLLILENTNWQIRLLSKSALLGKLVEELPEKYHERLILGFSIGTLDDKLARAIEHGTSSPTRRLKELHKLQDRGIRTFGMICPNLPQEDYDAFSREVCDAIRIEQCEHVWAEVMNVRGESLTRTTNALREAGFEEEAQRLESVSGPGSVDAWEDYARSTFEAHTKNVPPEKLRFLQYVKENSKDWWKDQRARGAILIGETAKLHRLTTGGESAPSKPLPVLTEEDFDYRTRLEAVVGRGVDSELTVATALHEIHSYQDGLLWKHEFRSFEDYCAARWEYGRSQSYRLLQVGEFLAAIQTAESPVGDCMPKNPGQIRPLVTKVVKESWAECWGSVVADTNHAGLTAPIIERQVKKFLRTNPTAAKKQRKPKSSSRAATVKSSTTPPSVSGIKKPETTPREVAQRSLEALRSALSALPNPDRFESLLQGIAVLISQEPKLSGQPDAHD